MAELWKTELTEENVGKRIGDVMRGTKKRMQQINAIALFGMDIFERDGNTDVLTKLLNGFVGVPGLATGQFKNWLAAHGLNPVKDSKNKRAWIVRKSKKVEYSRPTAPWFEFDSGADPQLMDVIKTLESTHTRIVKGQDQEAKRHFAPEQSDLAKAAGDKVASLIKELSEMGVTLPQAANQ